jgi:hypothetical protein
MKTWPLIAGLAVLTATVLCAQENLILNSDFHEQKTGKPKYWDTRITEISQGQLISSLNDAASLKTVAEFDVVNAGDAHPNVIHIAYREGKGRAMWLWTVPGAGKKFEPKGKYKFTMNVKYTLTDPPGAQAGMAACLNVWKADKENALVVRTTALGNYTLTSKQSTTSPPQQTEWKEYSFVFTMPDQFSAVGGWVGLIGAPGDLWADNFRLVPVDASTPDGPYE